VRARVKEQQRCQYQEDKGRISTTDCRSADLKGAIAKALGRLTLAIAKCSDTDLGNLTSCAATLSAEQTCLATAGNTAGDNLFDEVYPALPTPVPTNTPANTGTPTLTTTWTPRGSQSTGRTSVPIPGAARCKRWSAAGTAPVGCTSSAACSSEYCNDVMINGTQTTACVPKTCVWSNNTYTAKSGSQYLDRCNGH